VDVGGGGTTVVFDEECAEVVEVRGGGTTVVFDEEWEDVVEVEEWELDVVVDVMGGGTAPLVNRSESIATQF
jgi:hypothetical protein